MLKSLKRENRFLFEFSVKHNFVDLYSIFWCSYFLGGLFSGIHLSNISYSYIRESICTHCGYIYIYTQTLHLSKMRHKVNFLSRSLAGLNLEFSFSSTGCHSKVKTPSLPNYFHIAKGRLIGFMSFPIVLTLCEMLFCPGFELVSLCPFPTMVFVTLIMLLFVCLNRSTGTVTGNITPG